MAELKPDVVYIKGVHSITGADTKQDIGFPQIGMESLFEGATMKNIGNAGYNADKKYVYRNRTVFEPIKDTYHFSCIKDGYYSLKNKSFTGYYTKDDTRYKYHAVPAIGDNDWQKKLEFSNTIKDVNLYNIFISDDEADDSKIYLEDDEGYSYYTKNANKDYIKTARTAYDVLKDIPGIWDEPYICKSQIVNIGTDEEPNKIRVHSWVKDTKMTNGYYLYVDIDTDNEITTYNVGIFYLTFGDYNVCNTELSIKATIYKIPSSSGFDSLTSKVLYFKKSNSLIPFNVISNLSEITSFTEDFYVGCPIHMKQDTWLYPNFVAPVNADLRVPSNNEYKRYSAADFPLYDQYGNCDNVEKVKSTQYTIYEKTARSINYQYKSTSLPLQLIFTDKDIPTVLNDCGLTPGKIGADISNYVHLTNIEYNN